MIDWQVLVEFEPMLPVVLYFETGSLNWVSEDFVPVKLLENIANQKQMHNWQTKTIANGTMTDQNPNPLSIKR